MHSFTWKSSVTQGCIGDWALKIEHCSVFFFPLCCWDEACQIGPCESKQGICFHKLVRTILCLFMFSCFGMMSDMHCCVSECEWGCGLWTPWNDNSSISKLTFSLSAASYTLLLCVGCFFLLLCRRSACHQGFPKSLQIDLKTLIHQSQPEKISACSSAKPPKCLSA